MDPLENLFLELASVLNDPFEHLIIIWIGVLIAAYAAQITRLTPVLFFLFVGFVFGNIGLLPSEPLPFISNFAEFGILLVMFALGFEESPNNFIKGIKRSWGIAVFGALGPFLIAFAVADYFWGNTQQSIFFGITMTATAVSLSMVSLKSEGLGRSQVATGIMASAVLDVITSLMAVAILIPLATTGGDVTIAGLGFTLLKTMVFFVIVALLASLVFPHAPTGIFAHIPYLNRIGIKHIFSFQSGAYATLTVLTIALILAVGSHAFGIHPAVGAYMAGLILREEFFEFSDGVDHNHYDRIRRHVDQLAYSWIGPVFFVVLGTKIIFVWDIFVSVIPQTIALFLGVAIVQITSAALAARFTARFSRAESIMIGIGMLGRAELAFVVMDIAYNQHQILSTEMFYTLMFAIFWLNVSVPIGIKLWKPIFLRGQT